MAALMASSEALMVTVPPARLTTVPSRPSVLWETVTVGPPVLLPTVRMRSAWMASSPAVTVTEPDSSATS